MSTVQEIEKAVSQLSQRDLNTFRDWFQQFDQVAWDKQFEHDVDSGKLDSLADQAIADFRMGKCQEI